MRIYNNTNLINKKFLNAVIAIGNFDGVHLGHQELLNKAYIFSRKLRKKFGVFTFDPLPKDFFNGTDNKILNISEKVDIVKKFGADFFIKQIFNRNFSKRADGNPNTHAFVTSPEMVAALAISGRLDFNPITDTLLNDNGEEVKLVAPEGDELPKRGFDVEDAGFQAPAADGSSVQVAVSPTSDRLQLLAPFEAWDGKNITHANGFEL